MSADRLARGCRLLSITALVCAMGSACFLPPGDFQQPPSESPDCATDANCIDADACNGQERCVDGKCVDGTPFECPTAAATCRVAGCTTQDGEAVCGAVLAKPSTSCDDGDPCTNDDTCDAAGVCTGTSCVSSNPCESIECGPAGCQPGPSLDGESCELDGNPCTKGTCSSGQCNETPVGGTYACDVDANPCTLGICSAGTCVEPAAICDDANPCTHDLCTPQGCENPAKVDGTSCYGGIKGDSCWGGRCKSFEILPLVVTRGSNVCGADVNIPVGMGYDPTLERVWIGFNAARRSFPGCTDLIVDDHWLGVVGQYQSTFEPTILPRAGQSSMYVLSVDAPSRIVLVGRRDVANSVIEERDLDNIDTASGVRVPFDLSIHLAEEVNAAHHGRYGAGGTSVYRFGAYEVDDLTTNGVVLVCTGTSCERNSFNFPDTIRAMAVHAPCDPVCTYSHSLVSTIHINGTSRIVMDGGGRAGFEELNDTLGLHAAETVQALPDGRMVVLGSEARLCDVMSDECQLLAPAAPAAFPHFVDSALTAEGVLVALGVGTGPEVWTVPSDAVLDPAAWWRVTLSDNGGIGDKSTFALTMTSDGPWVVGLQDPADGYTTFLWRPEL